MDFWFPGEADKRIATYVPMHKIQTEGGTRKNPDLILYEGRKRDKKWATEAIREILGRLGISQAEIEKTVEETERLYEERLKVQAARLELRRRMEGQIPHMRKTTNSKGNPTWVEGKGHPLMTSYRQV